MLRLASAALTAIAIASAGAALAADGPGTHHQGAPTPVGSSIAGSGLGSGASNRGGVPIVAKPHCPAGSISCGKDCRPAGSACPKV